MTAGLRALFITLIVAAVAWTAREVPGFGYLPLVDDDVNIFFNPHMGSPGASTLRWMATDSSYVHRYMPLGWLGFSAVFSLSGLDPAGYHLAGLAFHAVSAVLVFLVLQQILLRFAGAVPERDRIASAGLASLLWALHPLRVETTAWCSGLLYAQAGFLALAFVWARLAELRARSEQRERAAAWCFAAAWAAFAASVLTYPVALFLPFAVAIVDHAWTAGDSGADRRSRRIVRLEMLGLGLTSLGALLLTVHARGTVVTSWGRTPTLAEFGVVSRLLQASYVALLYIWRTVWPVDVDWLPRTLFDADIPGGLGWVALVILVAVTGAALAFRKRAPVFAMCWVAYLILITPNLGLTEHPHTIADRYLYITSVTFSVALAMGLVRMRDRRLRAGALAACAAAAAACAAASVVQARIWRDMDAYYASSDRNPDPDLRHITVALGGKLRFLEGDVAGGREIARRELARAPGVGGVILIWRQIGPPAPLGPQLAATKLQEWAAAPFSCTDVVIARDQLDDGRPRDALLHLDAAVARSPDYVEARVRRGVLLAALGRPRDALHDWLFVERRDAGRASATKGEIDFMSSVLEKEFAEQGDSRAAALVRLERGRK